MNAVVIDEQAEASKVPQQEGNPVIATGTKPIVKYTGVTKSFGDLQVLKGIDLEMQPGEKVAVIGPSGSGKTTMGRMLMTLEEPTEGTIEVDGELLWHMEEKGKLVRANEKHLHRMRCNVGMVFQHFNLFPHMNVLRNVTEAPRKVLGLSKEEAEERAVSMLSKVGLADKLKMYPSNLSGARSSGLPSPEHWSCGRRLWF